MVSVTKFHRLLAFLQMFGFYHLSLFLGVIVPATSLISLKGYNISDVTVGGVSSGGYFAVQLHVAFSQTISGAAIVAAVMYI